MLKAPMQTWVGLCCCVSFVPHLPKLKNALKVSIVGFDFIIYYFRLAFNSTSISYVTDIR